MRSVALAFLRKADETPSHNVKRHRSKHKAGLWSAQHLSLDTARTHFFPHSSTPPPPTPETPPPCAWCPYSPPLVGVFSLFLNVWTPPGARKGSKLPVMVWLYGGGFQQGASSHPEYDGRRLAERGTECALWLVGWLVGWSAGWLAGWLVRWFVW